MDVTGVVPFPAALEDVSGQPAMEDMDVCEESKIVLDIPVLATSAALKYDYEVIATGDMNVCEESDTVVGISAVVSSVVPVSISDEITANMNVCEKSETDASVTVVANFDPLQTALGKKSASSEAPILNRLFRFALDSRALIVFCLWSSVSLGFDRVGSVTPGRGLTDNTRFSGVNSPVWVITSEVDHRARQSVSSHRRWVRGKRASPRLRVVALIVFCLWSSVSLGFDRAGSVTPGRGLASNTRFSGVNSLFA